MNRLFPPQEALGAAITPDSTESFVEMLLPVLLDFVKSLDPPPQGEAQLRQHCECVTHVNSVLLDILAMR